MIKRIARFKIYVDRARWYYVLLQFFIIILIYLETKGFRLDWWHYPVIIIIALAGMIVIGFIDRWIGMLKAEQKFVTSENPDIQEILKRLKELKE